jgi:hypothetical protein
MRQDIARTRGALRRFGSHAAQSKQLLFAAGEYELVAARRAVQRLIANNTFGHRE